MSYVNACVYWAAVSVPALLVPPPRRAGPRTWRWTRSDGSARRSRRSDCRCPRAPSSAPCSRCRRRRTSSSARTTSFRCWSAVLTLASLLLLCNADRVNRGYDDAPRFAVHRRPRLAPPRSVRRPPPAAAWRLSPQRLRRREGQRRAAERSSLLHSSGVAAVARIVQVLAATTNRAMGDR
jgi:hypothetical protein